MDETQNQTPYVAKKDVSEFIKKMRETAPVAGYTILDESDPRLQYQEVTLKPRVDDAPFQESMKTLRVNIEFSGAEGEVRVICVTSAFPNDGKSTTAYNLARAFAESGKKALLIDADMRKSVLRQQVVRVGGANCGLSNYLVGRATYEESVCTTSTRNLWIMFSGMFPPNPSELLGSGRFRQLVEKVKEEYSIVIIDTPPIGSVIDAAVVAKVCDGSVLVLRCGSVSYRFAQRCKEQLEATGTRILGCVLNDVDLNASSYYGKYYGQYYGTYYEKK